MNAKKEKDGEYFAVIDTETTWGDAVMSIGVAIADSIKFKLVEKKYYIISPEYQNGGMYSYALMIESEKIDSIDTRKKVIGYLIKDLKKYNIENIFAYNASFDYNHLPELKSYKWFDIMKIAAYKQYNPKIPESAECCGTGRLKRNYGVEPIMQLLSGNHGYCEFHNAICDAVDELEIMKLLNYTIEDYSFTQINSEKKSKIKRQTFQKQIQNTKELTTTKSITTEEAIEKHIIANCKFATGDKIRHTKYGYGVVRKVEAMNKEILLLTVLYETKGIRLHFLPTDEQEITIIHD